MRNGLNDPRKDFIGTRVILMRTYYKKCFIFQL